MDKYINTIMEILCNQYDYRIIELNDNDGLISKWAVIKNVYDGLQVTVFTDSDKIKSLDKDKLEKDCIVNLECNNILINYVLILDNEKTNVLSSDSSVLTNFIRENIIIINYEYNRIIYSNNSEKLVEELGYIVAYFDNKTNNKKRRYEKIPVLTYIIISLNVLVFLLTAYLSSSIFDINIKVLVFLGANNGKLVLNGEYYRLFTSMFLHGGIVHLLLNMYALYSLAPLIENIYGKFKFVLIYMISGIASSVLSCMFSKGISVGASGAIFGLFGSALIFALKNKDRIGKEFLKNIVSVIVINLIIGLSIPNIDNFGHIGGLIGGIITTMIVDRG